MRLSPEETRLSVGDVVEIVVEVARVQGLYGFDLQLAFDPQILEVVDTDPGREGVQVQQGDFLDPGFIARNEADNQSGHVWFVMTQLNPSKAKSGEGALVVVQFRGRQSPGETLVEIAHLQLANRDGVEILATALSARVEVIAPSGINPTQPSPSLPPTDTPVPGGPTVTSTTFPTSTPTQPAPTSSATAQTSGGSPSRTKITPPTEETGPGLVAGAEESNLTAEAGSRPDQTPTASESRAGEDGSRSDPLTWLMVVFSAGLGIGLIVLIFKMMVKRKEG